MSEQLQNALGAAYRVVRELGGGGMSRVFLATEVGLKRPMVIKVLPPELTSEVMAARFNRELEVTARVYDQDYTTIGIGKIMWMLDRGRVNQRLGNRQEAIDSYAFVTTAWPNADPELKAHVEEARRGLSELRSDPGRR